MATKTSQKRAGKFKQQCWVCSAQVKGKTVSELIPWPPPEPNQKSTETTIRPESDAKSEAGCRRTFRRKHGVAPETIIGPVYPVQKTSKSERLTVSPLQLTLMTGKTFRGIYKGWKVLAIGLKGGKASDGVTYNPNELVTIIPEEQQDKKAQPKLATKTGTVVRLNEIDNPRAIK